MPSAVELVRQFRHLRALVIGDAMLDTYLEGTAARLCTEGPVPVVRRTAEHRVPGGAANTAANLCALGATVEFLGIVGDDAAGRMLRKSLRDLGVDDRWLVEESGCTTHKMRILADGQYVVRFDEAEPRHDARAPDRLLRAFERAYPRCDVVVVSDYDYGAISDALIERIGSLKRSLPRPVVVDSKALYRFRAAGATVITPNQTEAQLLVRELLPAGGSPESAWSDAVEAERIGRQVLGLLDAECAAITMAGDGVLVIERDGSPMHVPAHPVALAHDIGAGDSFAAAIALALAAGGTTVEAAGIGVDAAGIAVSKRWTAVVQHQELLQRTSLREYAAQAQADPARRYAVSTVAARVAAERQAGRRVVFTNGVFDILHAGHVELLRQAKALGDVLVVGVNSDRSARRLKGPARPINGERDRLALVAGLDGVDAVVIFDEDDPVELIRALRPAIHVKGGDYAEVPLPEAEAVAEVGGQIVILPLVGGLSTSDVIRRIASLTTREQIGAAR